LRICYFGTYDRYQPRTRVILEGLRKSNNEVVECHADLWTGTSQKVRTAQHPLSLVRQFNGAVRSYRSLLKQASRMERCDVVIYAHMGQLDVILTAWWFKRQGVPVIWDALVSLYSTVVCDRQLVSPTSVSAQLLRQLDRLSSSVADGILVDTHQNRRYWQEEFAVPRKKLRVVNVGAEDCFARSQRVSSSRGTSTGFSVIFYGKYAPLHGIPTIVRAAHRLKDHSHIKWILIGKGQQRAEVNALVKGLRLDNVELIDWVPYEEIPARIAAANIGLGIFGSTDKAQRVVPNKAYQILAGCRPLVTADTPAARHVLGKDGPLAARLVKPGNSRELATAVSDLSLSPGDAAELAEAGFRLYCRHYSSKNIGKQVADICEEWVTS